MANNLKINTSIVFSLISVFCGYSFNLKFMLDTLGGKILNDKQVSYTLIGKKMFEKEKNKNNPIIIIKKDFVNESFYNIHKMNKYDNIIE